MSLTSDLEAAFERANLEVGGEPPVDNTYVEAYAKFQAEAIVNFLENAKFRITKLNAPVVVEKMKTPDQPVNIELETLLGEYQPVLKTLKKIGDPLGLGSLIDSLEGEIEKAVLPLLEGGATLAGLDLDKDAGGLEAAGYVFVGQEPDSMDDFTVEEEPGQREFTEVQFFREDNEDLI